MAERMKQVIAVRTDLKMGKGKIAAQSAHASIAAMEKTLREKPEWVKEWKKQGQAKVVVKVQSEQELLELEEKLSGKIPSAIIKDAGHTQVDAGTITALGIGPAPEKEMDKFTGKLKLL